MKKNVYTLLALSVLFCGCIGVSVDEASPVEAQPTTVKESTSTVVAVGAESTAITLAEDSMMDEVNTGNKSTYAVIETGKGVIKFRLYTRKAPVSSKNFIGLAERGFYDGLVFHRVEPGFVIQTGDPTGTGRGGSDKSIHLEIHSDLKHDLGAVGMARTSDPNSATSQFYIVIGEAHFLDGNYAVFGQVVEGLEVAKSIKVGDKMNKVSIVEE